MDQQPWNSSDRRAKIAYLFELEGRAKREFFKDNLGAYLTNDEIGDLVSKRSNYKQIAHFKAYEKVDQTMIEGKIKDLQERLKQPGIGRVEAGNQGGNLSDLLAAARRRTDPAPPKAPENDRDR